MENLQSKDLNQKENKDKSIEELAHRHMKDESHTTTDEELKNAKVVLTDSVKADEEKLSEVDNTYITTPLTGKNGENLIDDNDEKPMYSSYDILGG